MKCKNCGSYAVNIYSDRSLCDVCFLRAIITELEAENKELRYYRSATQGAESAREKEIKSLTADRDRLAKELKHWQANHGDMVRRCQFLSQRPDLPVDRIPAYEAMAKELEAVRKKLSPIEECYENWHHLGKDTNADILWQVIKKAAGK